MKKMVKSCISGLCGLALAITSFAGFAPQALAATGNMIQNGSFEEGAPTQTGITYHTTYPGWQISGGRLEIHRLPFTVGGDTYFASAANGVASAELNSEKGAPATIFQDFATVPGSVLSVKYAVSQRTLADTNMDVMMGAPGQESVVSHAGKTTVAQWNYITFNYTVPAGQTTTRIKFVPLNGTQTTVSNDLDDISVILVGEEPKPPQPTCKTTVTTGTAQSVTANTAVVTGNSYKSSQAINVTGIVLADNENFAGQDVYTTFATTPFSINNISGLRPSTTYYYRAFVHAADNQYYWGEVKTFTTQAGTVPSKITVTTGTAQNVTTTTAAIVNNSYAGTQGVSVAGLVLANNSGFVNQDVYTANVGTPYSINNVANLQPNTTYYYRAFIQAGGQYYWGEVKSFTTQGGSIPCNITVTTGNAQSVTANSATIASNSYTGTGSVVATGVAVSNNTSFTNQVTFTTNVSNPFSVNASNLNASTTYYYKAYVMTSTGQYFWGATKSFCTSQATPVSTVLFEQNFEGYSYSPFKQWGYVTSSFDAGKGYNGSVALHISKTNGGFEYTFQGEPNTTYELTAYGKVACVGQTFTLGIKNTREFYETFSSTNYEQKTARYTTDSKGTGLIAYIYVPAGKSCDAYVDNVVLKKVK